MDSEVNLQVNLRASFRHVEQRHSRPHKFDMSSMNGLWQLVLIRTRCSVTHRWVVMICALRRGTRLPEKNLTRHTFEAKNWWLWGVFLAVRFLRHQRGKNETIGFPIAFDYKVVIISCIPWLAGRSSVWPLCDVFYRLVCCRCGHWMFNFAACSHLEWAVCF